MGTMAANRRSIKITVNQYEKIISLMRPRETFSDVIERLFEIHDAVSEIKQTLGPDHYLAQRPERDKEAAAASQR